MRIIGLTGGIACGKSNISRILTNLGATVIDGDLLSRELTSPNGIALPKIRQCFGDRFFLADGCLNRRLLGSFVFSDQSQLDKLDSIMQPLLQDLILHRIEQAHQSGVAVCVLDMPLLFEKKLDSLCDTIWSAWVPAETQLLRLMQRDGCSRQEAINRIQSQYSADEKAARSQIVIDTTGSIEETATKIPPLYQAELSRALSHSYRRRSERYEKIQNNYDLVSFNQSENVFIHRTSSTIKSQVAVTSISSSELNQNETMQRPVGASQKQKADRKIKREWLFPSPLLISIIVLFFAGLILFTSDSLMNAWLVKSKEAREIAYQHVINQHPLGYRDLIEKYAGEYNLHPAFVSAIIMNESSFRTDAESSVGARGLMQLMPDTAGWIADKLHLKDYSFDRMYDAETNIHFGCWYLNYLCSLFRGDPVSVSCAYHAGQGTVTAWLSDSSRSDDGIYLRLENLPDGPTKSYAREVTQDYGIYKVLYFTITDHNVPQLDPVVIADLS